MENNGKNDNRQAVRSSSRKTAARWLALTAVTAALSLGTGLAASPAFAAGTGASGVHHTPPAKHL